MSNPNNDKQARTVVINNNIRFFHEKVEITTVYEWKVVNYILWFLKNHPEGTPIKKRNLEEEGNISIHHQRVACRSLIERGIISVLKISQFGNVFAVKDFSDIIANFDSLVLELDEIRSQTGYVKLKDAPFYEEERMMGVRGEGGITRQIRLVSMSAEELELHLRSLKRMPKLLSYVTVANRLGIPEIDARYVAAEALKHGYLKLADGAPWLYERLVG